MEYLLSARHNTFHTGTVQLGQLHIFTILTIKTHDEEKQRTERSHTFHEKLFILFIPFIALLAVYFLDDPFMVLKNYERYDQTPVVLNEGHVGWQMYLNNRDTIPIDSYIMGNSCTMAYQCHEWEKYLHGGRAVRLFGNAESLAAVCLKLKHWTRQVQQSRTCC